MARINSTARLAGPIRIGLIAVILSGCTSQPTPNPALISIPLPSTATSLLSTATIKPNQTAQPKNPLPDMPLSLGTTWVYSDIVYSGSKPQDILTSTYIYTDVVISTRSESLYFAAEISRTVALISGERLFNGPEAQTWWYVLTGTHVYRQPGNALDLLKESSSWLEYSFPLSQDGWLPDPDIRQHAPPDSSFSGKRFAYSGEEAIVPAGVFKDCFLIATVYLNGPTYAWFCPKLGIAEEKYNHAGTPFGYHAVLLNYSIPP